MTILVVSNVAKLNLCEEVIFGTSGESIWESFDTELWTFIVDVDQSIFDENVHIFGDKSESVKGMSFDYD